jgi:hypothetical protein
MSRLRGNQYTDIAGTRPSFPGNNLKPPFSDTSGQQALQSRVSPSLFDFGHELAEVDSRSNLAWLKVCVFIVFHFRRMEVELRSAYVRI